jgi:EmrB/QacA subfamily drug resistance transporter
MASSATYQPSAVSAANKRWTLIAMILSSGIVFLDGTVVNVALPSMDRDLRAGLSGLQWIVDGYALTLAAFIILGGSMGDVYGRRRVMLGGLVGFGIASMACGLAQSTEWLIGARVLQGLAGAALVPGALAVLRAVYTDEEERGRAIGAWSGWAGITTVLGPPLGGWLVDTLSWHWVFFLNVPVLAAAAWLLTRCVPETRDPNAPPSLDWPGGILAVLALGGTTYGLIEGPTQGWTSPLVVLGLAGGVVALGLFLWVEAHQRQPMVPLALFRSRNFSATNAATLGMYGALSASMFFVAQYVQNFMGYSATLAGTVFLPISFFMLVLSPRFGGLAGHYGSRLFMTVGPLLFGAGIVWLAFLRPDSSYLVGLLPAALVMGLGLSTTVAPLTAAVMGSVPGHNAGVASAVNNAASRVGGLLAIAGLGAVLALSFPASVASLAQQGGASLDAAAQAQLAEAVSNPAVAMRSSDLAPPVRTILVEGYTAAYREAMLASAALAAAAALISFIFVRHETVTSD